MVKKLVVMLMAVLFSLSVSGMSFAQEKPAAPTAEKPAQPCAGAEKQMKKKAAKKKAAKKKATKKEEAAPMAPEKPAAPAEKK